jgi:hypothetical protein
MYRKLLLPVAALVLTVALSATAVAQAIESPPIKPGDSWIYRVTREKGTAGSSQRREEITVVRMTSSSIYATVKEPGSTQVPREVVSPADWSRARNVNGQETVVNKPLSFPLSVGQSWTVEYSEDHPNAVHKSESAKSTNKVVGFEDIEVPAGKFHAVKIEVEGRWTAQMAPRVAAAVGTDTSADGTRVTAVTKKVADTTVTGRFYKAFWYVPEVKRWVKSVEEYYSGGGVRSESVVEELESYKVN